MAIRNKYAEMQQQIITDVRVGDFFRTRYKEYAKYVLENRAIPSIIDGLKTGGRKTLHAAFKTLSTTREEKSLNLVGATYRHSHYVHGDAPLQDAIITLTKSYANTFAPLEIIGSGGSLRGQENAALRYLDIKLSKHSFLYREDIDIVEYVKDGENTIEPYYYLPILPMVLFQRNSGIAIGYAFSATTSYNPLDVIKVCKEYLNTKKIESPLRPFVEQFKGTFGYDDKYKRDVSVGKYEIEQSGKYTTVIIQEAEMNATYTKIEQNLNRLQDTEKIKRWLNVLDADKNNVYKVVMTNDQYKSMKKNLTQTLKIESKIAKPNYTLLDEFGKVIVFDNPTDIIKYFVDFRLGKYKTLKKKKIRAIKNELSALDEHRRFIELYLDGKVKLDRETPISVTKKTLTANKIKHSVLNIPIIKLTKEEYQRLVKKIEATEKRLDYVTNTTHKEMYIEALNSLHKHYRTSFPK